MKVFKFLSKASLLVRSLLVRARNFFRKPALIQFDGIPLGVVLIKNRDYLEVQVEDNKKKLIYLPIENYEKPRFSGID